MTTTDFPIDPQLVAAIEAVYARPELSLTPFPSEWLTAATPRHLNSKRSQSKRNQLVKRDGDLCFYCGTHFENPDDATLDHVIPFRMTRTWSTQNLVLACVSCNYKKADQIPSAFMPMLAALVLNQVRLTAAPVERSLVVTAVA